MSTPLIDKKADFNYGSFSSGEVSDISLDESLIGLEDVPHGRHLGLFSLIIMFVARIIGSGIFATPSDILVNTGGCPALFIAVWIIAGTMAFSGLYLYLEMGSLVPRSGGTKVFLEFVYSRPKLLTSVCFSTYTVFTGFAMSNSIIFGKYLMYALGYDEQYVVNTKVSSYCGMVLVVLVCLLHGTSVKHGVRVQNFLGALKLVLVCTMTITGVYVIAWGPKSTNGNYTLADTFKFKDASKVSTASLTSALIQSFFCFAGWNSAHTVASEVKDPVRTFRIAGPVSLGIALVNYLFMNVAYLKVFSYDEIKNAGPLVGSLLFERVYGYTIGRQFVTLSIALSTASNVFVVVYAISRMNQEIFREGYLPFSTTLASNKPFGAPFMSTWSCGLLTLLWLWLLPSDGKGYAYLISMEGYPGQFFLLLVCIGLFVVRHWYPEKRAPIRANMVGVAILCFFSLYMLIGPFIGPQPESSRIHGLPPYHITAIIMVVLSVAFWFVKFQVLPWLGRYELVPQTKTLDDGLTVKEWTKHYL